MDFQDRQRDFWLRVGSFNAASAVALGAFGAHFLKTRYDPRSVEIWQTGTLYHFFHSLALIIVSFMDRPNSIAGLGFLSGCLLFSGSLYFLVLFPSYRWIGRITPIGGLMFIAGWLCLAWNGWSTKKK
eukprot:TRINITY_DN937_c0_g1_i1.p1 TRINITY_DN937_c0_g1~~TRINITY_DN937_c0_g1_i1.p1  ORF type:complete len:128 (-),score=9.78 TRINITY_DN937_c0_g1_i1:207-590(-)